MPSMFFTGPFIKAGSSELVSVAKSGQPSSMSSAKQKKTIPNTLVSKNKLINQHNWFRDPRIQ